MPNKISEISLVIAGEAGQGVQSIEVTLVNVIKQSGCNVFATKEYMSRVRGGINSTQIRVSKRRRASYVEKTDIFIPLEKQAIDRLSDRIGFTVTSLLPAYCNILQVNSCQLHRPRLVT